MMDTDMLEANFIIEGAGHEVGRNAALCNSRLASLPVQEMVVKMCVYVLLMTMTFKICPQVQVWPSSPILVLCP